MTATTSSFVSPMPRMMPVLVGMCGARRLAVVKMSITRVVAAAGPAPLVEPRHRLRVVIVDVGLRLEHGLDRGLLRPGSRGRALRPDVSGQPRLDLPDRLGEGPGAEVGQVVAVDRGEHHVLQPHASPRPRRPARAPPGRTSADGRGRPRSRRSSCVQTSPRIMNVAVPCSQHSPTFGQCASSQTVCRSRSRMSCFRRR